MMNSTAAQTEERLATELNSKVQSELVASGIRSACLAGLSMAIGVFAALAGLTMISLCGLLLGLIFLSQYLDARGQLKEVQRRSTKTWVSDFSMLRRPSSEGSVKNSTMS
jgi:hypothetical protein